MSPCRSNSSHIWDIYANELISRGYGHPLWYPDPDTKDGQVEIGDVGYIHRGRFHRLFNVLSRRNEGINKSHGVPDNFVPIRIPDGMWRDEPNCIIKGEVLASHSIEKVKVGAKASVSQGSVGGGAGYSFVARGKRGAVAALKDACTQKYVARCEAFEKYIREHHLSWYKYVRDRKMTGVDITDIVLVYGWTKTSRWALAAYDARKTSHDASFSISAGALASAEGDFSLDRSAHIPLQKHRGPQSSKLQQKSRRTSNREKDQCVFVQYYKCLPRGLGITTFATEEDVAVGECLFTPFMGCTDFIRRWCGSRCLCTPSKRPKDPIDILLYYLSESAAKAARGNSSSIRGAVAPPAGPVVASHHDLDDLFPEPARWPKSEDLLSVLREMAPQLSIGTAGVVQLAPQTGSTHSASFHPSYPSSAHLRSDHPVDLPAPSQRLVAPPHRVLSHSVEPVPPNWVASHPAFSVVEVSRDMPHADHHGSAWQAQSPVFNPTFTRDNDW